METSCATSGTSGHRMEVHCKMKWQSKRMPDLIYETKTIDLMAEREGFEPSVLSPVQRFSRPPRSTTPAPLRGCAGGCHPAGDGPVGAGLGRSGAARGRRNLAEGRARRNCSARRGWSRPERGRISLPACPETPRSAAARHGPAGPGWRRRRSSGGRSVPGSSRSCAAS